MEEAELPDAYAGAGDERYRVGAWGGGYFKREEGGDLRVFPQGPDGHSARLDDIIDSLNEQGLSDPYLLRFPQILENRQARIREAFEAAIELYDYPQPYRGVYPVKVNHNHIVVSTLARAGRAAHFGLEVGSKAELCLALTIDLSAEALVVCNGFKDRDYLELAAHAASHGRRILVIAENPQEVDDIIGTIKEVGVLMMIGLRARLHSEGAGRWLESSGAKGKFGLSTMEIVEAMEQLDREGLVENLRALHFHIGSQVSDILNLKEAIKEASRLFCSMQQRASGLDILDIGGGLSVDYDGSRSATDWSMNYSLHEYARDVVYIVKSICDESGARSPTIVTESGRALTAHHAAIVVSTLRVVGEHEPGDYARHDTKAVQIADLKETLEGIKHENYREAYHDAEQLLNELILGFKMGYVSMEDRAVGECLHNDICASARRLMRNARKASGVVREDIKDLERKLAPKYVCNFSIFMSAPDSWAVQQLFPVCPLTGFDDARGQAATIGDITCDSDGKLEHFIGQGKSEPFLWLPELEPGQSCLIGMFLVGAYQDVLGDFHNLFGTAAEGVIEVTGEDEFRLIDTDEGSSVESSLAHFGFSPHQMVRAFDRKVDRSRSRESVQDYRGAFLRVLHGNTYLQKP
ncbi:MAG: biosynthetic arginine decarboxylase [Planctomycetota bacterium]